MVICKIKAFQRGIIFNTMTVNLQAIKIFQIVQEIMKICNADSLAIQKCGMTKTLKGLQLCHFFESSVSGNELQKANQEL